MNQSNLGAVDLPVSLVLPDGEAILPERRPFTNVPLNLIIAIFANQAIVMHSNKQEPILVLAVLLALVQAVINLKSLQWQRSVLNLAVKDVDFKLSLLSNPFSSFDSIDYLLVI